MSETCRLCWELSDYENLGKIMWKRWARREEKYTTGSWSKTLTCSLFTLNRPVTPVGPLKETRAAWNPSEQREEKHVASMWHGSCVFQSRSRELWSDVYLTRLPLARCCSCCNRVSVGLLEKWERSHQNWHRSFSTGVPWRSIVAADFFYIFCFVLFLFSSNVMAASALLLTRKAPASVSAIISF